MPWCLCGSLQLHAGRHRIEPRLWVPALDRFDLLLGNHVAERRPENAMGVVRIGQEKAG